MKNILTRTLILSILISSIISISCGEHDPMIPEPEISLTERTNDMLEDGSVWNISSFKVNNQDFSSEIQSGEITIKKKSTDSGSWKWDIIYDDGTAWRETQEYELRSDGNKIDFSDGTTMELDVNSSRLIIEGNIEGDEYQVKAN